MDITKLAEAGGIFFILTFIHFVVDWVFQSHHEAMNKHNNTLIRAKHCLVYTVGFLPIMAVFQFKAWEMIAACLILFASHFIEDTYIPVYFWAKYIRRPSEMIDLQPHYQMMSDGRFVCYPTNDKEGFFEFAKTPIGKILVIVVDQIIHLIFLLPLVWMALN
jgi:hypothetical protein